MRRISRSGGLWMVVVVLLLLLNGAALNLPVTVMAEDRPSPPRVSSYAYPYTDRTPQRPTAKKPSVDPNAAFAAKVKPGSFALVLNDGNRYIWTPAADQKLPLKTAFAKVEVPLALVAAVTFSDEQGAVKVAFRNGDIVSGKLLLKELEIRTAYGDLTVPVSAMTFLGAGGVTKVVAKPMPQPNAALMRYPRPAVLPPRPVPDARVLR